MKPRKRVVKKENKSVKITIICLIAIILLCILILMLKITNNDTVYAYENNIIQNENRAPRLEDKIEQKVENKNIKKEIETEEIELEYTTLYQEDETIPKGTIQILQEGRNGKRQIITEKIYENDELVEENIVSDKIVKASINKIVVTGTAKYKSNYKPKKGDTLYVTSETLELRESKDSDSEKIYTLSKDENVILQGISGDWYEITYKDYTGFVQAKGLTYINPQIATEVYEEGVAKEKLLANLNFNMALNKPSGLSLEQFQKVLSGNSKDVNKIFENNARYFYYIEKQYNINGVFVAALGIHDSAWGTSYIAQIKINLFGYGAKDSNPYGGAYSFENYSEGIDLIARVLTKYYLNPAGTRIYDNQVATGDYYNGNSLTAVNKKYASDSNWANSIYNYMKYLYNRL